MWKKKKVVPSVLVVLHQVLAEKRIAIVKAWTIQNKFVGKNFLKLPNIIRTVDGVTITIENDIIILNGTATADSFINITPSKPVVFSANTSYTLGAFNAKTVGSAYLTGTYASLRIQTSDNSQVNAVLGNVNSKAEILFNEDKTLRYLVIRTGVGITYDNFEIKPMICLTSNYNNYEPYQENNLDINLQGNFIAKIGDVADTLRVENGRAILTKRIGKVILDGSENWSYDQVYAIFSSNVLSGAKDDKEVINTLSDRFVSVSYNNRGGDFARIYANNSWVAIRGVKQTTVDEFKIWLQANPMTVYYVLTEPYEVDLGEVTMPKTYEGVTNISMIANLESNMKLKYVRSTNIVVDNLAKAIVALGGEINV